MGRFSDLVMSGVKSVLDWDYLVYFSFVQVAMRLVRFSWRFTCLSHVLFYPFWVLF